MFLGQVHKSSGPMVFLSKMLGMLPVIWTEDETESECKSYFNLYTFAVFIGKHNLYYVFWQTYRLPPPYVFQ